jgi:hypothetical protein
VSLCLVQEAARARADDVLIAETHKERGTVRWYTVLAVNGSKPGADAIEKKYPFLLVRCHVALHGEQVPFYSLPGTNREKANLERSRSRAALGDINPGPLSAAPNRKLILR